MLVHQRRLVHTGLDNSRFGMIYEPFLIKGRSMMPKKPKAFSCGEMVLFSLTHSENTTLVTHFSCERLHKSSLNSMISREFLNHEIRCWNPWWFAVTYTKRRDLYKERKKLQMTLDTAILSGPREARWFGWLFWTISISFWSDRVKSYRTL